MNYLFSLVANGFNSLIDKYPNAAEATLERFDSLVAIFKPTQTTESAPLTFEAEDYTEEAPHDDAQFKQSLSKVRKVETASPDSTYAELEVELPKDMDPDMARYTKETLRRMQEAHRTKMEFLRRRFKKNLIVDANDSEVFA